MDQHQAPGALKRRGMRIATTPTLLEKAIPDFEAGFCDFQVSHLLQQEDCLFFALLTRSLALLMAAHGFRRR